MTAPITAREAVPRPTCTPPIGLADVEEVCRMGRFDSPGLRFRGARGRTRIRHDEVAVQGDPEFRWEVAS